MKPRDIFHLAVRLLGLLFLYHGVSNLPVIFNRGLTWLFVVCYLAAAWWLLTSHWLTKLAYPDEKSEANKTTETRPDPGHQPDA